MIAIVNVTERPAETGPHDYEVRINRQVITRFQHRREDGLAKCLRLAADAVDEAREKEFVRFVEAMVET
jgi:hypothetical protein